MSQTHPVISHALRIQQKRHWISINGALEQIIYHTGEHSINRNNFLDQRHFLWSRNPGEVLDPCLGKEMKLHEHGKILA